MAFVRESVDKGLVTARDPALLNPGEVQRAINCIYRPNSPGLWKAPGRSTYNSAALASSVKGVRFLAFDNAQGIPVNIIVAHVGSEYRSSTLSAETGAFALLSASPGSGPTLDAIYYQNRHYLLNGNTTGNGNLVAKISETTGNVTTRQHGLNVVTNTPTLASAAGEGWPASTDFGTGFYFFFSTEVVNPGAADEIESAISGSLTPLAISLPNLTNGVLVTLPTIQDNATATHRRVYIVGPKDSSIWNPFFLVEARALATIPVTQTTITFGLNATSVTVESKNPNATVSSPGWTNPNNTFTADNNTARADFNGNQLVQSFASFTPAAAIQGIEVAIRQAYFGVIGTMTVELSWNAGVNWTAPVFVDLSGSSLFFHFPKVGARNNRWGRTWTAAELSAANFRIRITTQGGAAGQGQVSIDVINVFVYSGATTSTEPIKGAYYPITSAKIGPTVTVISANTPPPTASTGDIFESCLVLNDVSNGQLIRFSTVDAPDYFPSIYFISLRGKQGDHVVLIRRLNGVLIVGMSQSLFRVNYLPTADSIELGRGICYEAIAEDHGIISTQGATIFTPAGSAEQLAYVSAVGLRYTDGLHTDYLTEDIDWPNTVNVSKLDKCVLVNEPNLSSLVLYYIPAGDNSSTAPTRALYFSYHPSKIKDNGKLAVAGPVTVDVASSTIGYLNNLPIHLTGNSTGTVSVEDRGAGSQEVDIVLRDIFPDGFGSSFRVRKHWFRVAQHDPGVKTTIIPFTKDHDDDYADVTASESWQTKSFQNNFVNRIPGDTLTPRNLSGFAKLSSDFMAESYTLRIITERIPGQANGDFALQMIAYDAVDKGEHNTK